MRFFQNEKDVLIHVTKTQIAARKAVPISSNSIAVYKCMHQRENRTKKTIHDIVEKDYLSFSNSKGMGATIYFVVLLGI